MSAGLLHDLFKLGTELVGLADRGYLIYLKVDLPRNDQSCRRHINILCIHWVQISREFATVVPYVGRV